MSDSRFLRKANPDERLPYRVQNDTAFLDDDDTPLLRLLRDLFIERKAPYCVKELAADMGISVFSVYKMFAGDRPLRAEALLRIISFIGFKNDKDARLVDFVCGHAGFVAMPKMAHAESVREILAIAADITKKEES